MDSEAFHILHSIPYQIRLLIGFRLIFQLNLQPSREVLRGMFHEAQLNERYPLLSKLSEPLKKAERDIVGRQHETMQLLASMSRPELCNALLLAEAGSGKLLPLGTPIPTPSGWTAMSDLQPGDFVLGRDGKPTRVSYVSEVDETPVLYDIALSDGQVVTACADHQWLVASVSGRAESYSTNVATTQARRDRVQVRREALLALAKGDVPEFSTAGELINLINGIAGVTWHRSTGLHTYLSKQGVERRDATRTTEQIWKGGTRVSTVRVHEFNTQIALKALSEQVFRRTSWGTNGNCRSRSSRPSRWWTLVCCVREAGAVGSPSASTSPWICRRPIYWSIPTSSERGSATVQWGRERSRSPICLPTARRCPIWTT
ncbi:Hint domain-containing protein [Streptomyces sp. FXJ1.4098]|nr:Hint domain-containing protein [Streptomyces sp. FXJ1.4098]